MRKILIPASLLLLSSNFPAYAYFDAPRLYLWGLSGSETIGRVDGLLPVIRTPRSFLYTDLQGKVGSDNGWLVSGGAGYRGLAGNNIFGGYLFYDRNVSPEHNIFYMLSPGVEVINNCWDGRLNLYFPVSERRKRGPSFFPSGDNACGEHGDCDFVEFHGHQQFEHRFFNFEEVGTGGDAEVGTIFARVNNLAVHAGVYYYQFQDESDLRGVQARAEFPVNNNFGLTVESSYDNKDSFAVVGGIRLQFGPVPAKKCLCITDHFYDRVARHLGPADIGSGVPTEKGRKDEGLFLRRDNIYFFTASGGTVFNGVGTGTFENPLRADQFSSATLASVRALTGNGNFYFNTGTYVLGATSVTVLEGQSLFGRTLDYRCTAEGAERPILSFAVAGSPALIVTGGNNVIDSIILQNIVAGPAEVIALDVENNSGLFICNSVIDAEAIVTGDNNDINAAIALVANNSNVTIDPTVIRAVASVSGSNNSGNIAIGIGSNALSSAPTVFNNNNFVLNNVTVIANSRVASNEGFLSGIGIGNEAGSFVGNNFDIRNTVVNAQTITEGGTNNALLFVIGIGNNGMTMTGNNFKISNSQINAAAISGDNNVSNIHWAGGIGEVGGDFNNNTVELTDSAILVTNFIGGISNDTLSAAVGLGGLAGSTFENNTISVARSEIIVTSDVGSNQNVSSNTVVGYGSFLINSFNNNVFNVSNSFVQATARVRTTQDATSTNTSFGMSATSTIGPNANIFNIDRSGFLVQALVGGVNSNLNEATGLFANSASVVNASNNIFNIFALVGTNAGTNTADDFDGTGQFNLINNIFNLFSN